MPLPYKPKPRRASPEHGFDQGAYRLLVAGLVVAVLTWTSITIGDEMGEGETRAFDMAILRAARSLRALHPGMAEVMRDLSGLGSVTVLTLLSVFTVGYLAVVRSRPVALSVAAVVITGSVGVSLLKTWFGRPRPDVAFAYLVVPGMSFPSGHAAMSAIVFLTLGVSLANARSRTREQLYILAVATLMTVLVGISRIALGVHWATDVLAGWAMGTAWALFWLLVTQGVARASRAASPGRLGA